MTGLHRLHQEFVASERALQEGLAAAARDGVVTALDQQVLEEMRRRSPNGTHSAILDTLPVEIALLDRAGIIVLVNDAWRRFAAENNHASHAASVGLNYLAVCDAAVGPDAEHARLAAQGIREVLQQARAGFLLEYPCHGPDRQRWFRLVTLPMSGGGALLMHLNITAERMALEAAQEGQFLLDNALRMAGMGSWMLDIPKDQLWWSPETHLLFGVPPSRFSGTLSGFLEMVLPEDLSAELRALSTPSGPFAAEYRIRRPDGAVRWMEERGTVDCDAAGVPVRRRGVVMDITARKEREAERHALLVREQAARKEADAASRYYRTLFESAPGCYTVLDPEGFRIVAASDAYLQATLTTREAITGRGIFDVFPDNPDDPLADGEQKLRASLTQVVTLRTRDVMPVQRYPVRTAGGSFVERFWSVVNSPVIGPDGVLAYIIVRVVDVTEYILHQRAAGATVLAAPLAIHEQLAADIVLRGQELARANAQLARNQAMLRIAGRTAKLGGWVVTLPAGTVAWSDETAAIHDEPAGFSPPLDRALAYYDAETGGVLRQAFEACVKDGIQFDVEARIITAAGRLVQVRAIGEAARDAAGKITHVQGAFQDISTLKQSEATLKASEERFRLLSKATNDAIWDWDLVTSALWWNEGITTLFGYLPEDLEPTALSWSRHIHPEDHAAVMRSIRAAIDGGAAIWSGEYRFVRKDGGAAYVLDRGHIIRDASGRAVRMIGGMTDLTERKAAEEKLREQATLLDGASDAIIVRDLHQRVVSWNRGAERLYGWKASEVLGRDLSTMLAADAATFHRHTRTVMETGEWTGELERRSRDGRTVTVLGRWTLLHDARGQPRGILSINTDITERKKLEEQVLRSQRLDSIGTLAGGIAHDLNNMLSPILMSIAMLRNGETDPDRLEDLDTIQTCARRGADMAQQLLSFARGNQGRRMRVDLRRICTEVQAIIRDTFPKNIRFHLEAAERRWDVHADPTHLHQLLTNLCVNARDAMPRGGTLTVSLQNVVLDALYARLHPEARTGAYLVLSVEDTGTGMPPEVANRIFEPFFTTKEPGKGTGLGLSTVHTIVRSHQGFITLYSEPGQGTRFKVYLPAELPEDPGPEPLLEPSRLPRGNGELILVVDDEDGIRIMARRTLEGFGYRVMVAANGAQAVGLYAQHQSDVALVLTDMNMPVMDGPATIIALKAINPGVRLVASSGLDINGGLAKAVDAGVTQFVPKPYTAETLLQVLHQALARD